MGVRLCRVVTRVGYAGDVKRAVMRFATMTFCGLILCGYTPLFAQNQANGTQNVQAEPNAGDGAVENAAVAENATPNANDTPAKEERKSQELPAPEMIGGQDLMTSDRVALTGTWFGSVRGKDAAPVLLLSGTGRSRNDYQKLAPFLQQQGFAVLAVNLRTAGNATMDVPETDDAGDAETTDEESEEDADTTKNADASDADVTDETVTDADATTEAANDSTPQKSTTKKTSTAKKTTPTKVERPWSKMQADDVAAIVLDIQACCKWLAKKNNEEELNLNKLCIVAADANCIAAVDCAVQDWNRMDERQRSFTTTQPVRQSQFTKALVFLSPAASVRGYDLTKLVLQNAVVEQKMPVMLFVGAKNKDDLKDAARIKRTFEKIRRNEKDIEDKADKTFFYWECPTEATGTAMLAADPKLAGWIAQFLRTKVGNVQIPWNYVGPRPQDGQQNGPQNLQNFQPNTRQLRG